jgi:uncharacterized membrane protein
VSTDPYAAPKTHVADVPEIRPDGKFDPSGFSRPAGHGWDWIKSARQLTKQQAWTWMGIFVLFALLGGGLGAIPVIGTLAVYFVMPLLFGGIMIACNTAYKGQPVSVGHLFAGFSSHAGKLIGIGLATLLVYVVVFLIIGVIFGSEIAVVLSGIEQPYRSDPAFILRLTIAGLVVLALTMPLFMAIWFSYALVVINEFSAVQALRTSFIACLKNIVPFLIYGVMTFLLSIAATIPLALGWLILGPVLFASLYTGYRDIFYEA